MRTSRMIEMIYLLLDNRQQKAQVLADHFNVSTKTIYRDVETLHKAGIPITMQQGVSGGIILDERYMTNQKKLSAREEKGLTSAIDNIKKLPNAQLEYALKMLKQYFNEAGTMWVNDNNIALDIQNIFHKIKVAIIEKNVIEFKYFNDMKFLNYVVEPYELRINGDVWTLLVRCVGEGNFKELYISRMKNIQITSMHFKRIELPEIYSKKYHGEVKKISFKIEKLTERLLNRFSIEDFNLQELTLSINVKVDESKQELLDRYPELK